MFANRNPVGIEISQETVTTSRRYFPEPLSRKKRKREDVTLEWCLEVAKGYKSFAALQKSRHVLLELCDERGWTDKIQAIFPSQPTADTWNSKEACRQEALKYTHRKQFRKNCPLAYTAAVCHRWLDDVCSHMEVSEYRKFDSFEKCREEASRYSRRGDFIKYSEIVYKSASKYGWLDEICEHMSQTKRDFDFWEDKENCRAEALKYSTREEFRTMHQTAYLVSVKYGWLDEICEHMAA